MLPEVRVKFQLGRERERERERERGWQTNRFNVFSEIPESCNLILYHISADLRSTSKNRISKVQNHTRWTNAERPSSTCGDLHCHSQSPSPPRYNDNDCTANIRNALRENEQYFRKGRAGFGNGRSRNLHTRRPRGDNIEYSHNLNKSWWMWRLWFWWRRVFH